MKTRYLLLPVLGALLLSGCSSTRLPLCPSAAVLADAAMRAELKPGAVPSDPAAALYTVSVTGVTTSCTLDRSTGQTDSNVSVNFRAMRAPTAQAARYSLPYFIAINQGARVIDKRVYNTAVEFAPGAATATFSATVNSTVLKLENGHLPTDYQFLAGLQLSDAERAYLKTMSRYAP